MHRKTAPKVTRGKVQRKNRWRESRAVDPSAVLIRRERPIRGYRHLLSAKHVHTFLALLPEWEELAVGLESIVLGRGGDSMGWHESGTVGVEAWEEDLWWDDADPAFLAEHRALFEQLGIEHATLDRRLVVKWTEEQARTFQLLHVLLHELGHHHDRLTTRSRRSAARGEAFAEHYAHVHSDRIWERFVVVFDV